MSWGWWFTRFPHEDAKGMWIYGLREWKGRLSVRLERGSGEWVLQEERRVHSMHRGARMGGKAGCFLGRRGWEWREFTFFGADGWSG